jgi:cation diffusion facilitator CzcD-associated flavoprotein CzcO
MESPVSDPTITDVVVVGAGFAGLYAVHHCRSAGLTVRGVEAADDVGGVWYWNRYPGARCDVESIDYSYSFDDELQREWVWTERYATQPEILRYLEHVADRFDLRPAFAFGHRVVRASYESTTATWLIASDRGDEWRARFLVLATGPLSAPQRLEFSGMETYQGEILSTAEWPQKPVSFAGRRVGIIGTGSSGIQAIPIIAESAASLTVFQRTANYTVPVLNRLFSDEEQVEIRAAYSARRAKSKMSAMGQPQEPYPKDFAEVDADERDAAFEARWTTGGVLFARTFSTQTIDPLANQAAAAFAAKKIRAIVQNPALAADLTPTDHPIGTKRIITDSGYYETFNRKHVRLVNLRREPIVSMEPAGVRTTEALYALDTVIFATGFDALTGSVLRIDITGSNGVSLAEAWRQGPITYLGLATPGFPNLFIIAGPGSPSVLTNVVLAAEQQVEWLVKLFVRCIQGGFESVEAQTDAATRWTSEVDTLAQRTLFPRANSWYLGANIAGKPRVFLPYIGGLAAYRERCDECSADHYAGFTMGSRWTEISGTGGEMPPAY